MAQKEQCFIITPIGDDTDPIRRHIEGIIDAAIIPALGDQYEIVVAHKMGDLGSITKQVIDKVYHSKLVIANLTNRNPNVMYELALRHATGKPAIMIAERGTPLPSDIIMQRTIFYYNDAKGVLELRDELKKAVCTIDFEKKSGPIVDVLGDISHDAAMLNKVAEKDSEIREPFEYIMQRLDRIENSIISKGTPSLQAMKSLMYIFHCDYFSEGCDLKELEVAITDYLSAKGFEKTAWDVGDGRLYIGVKCPMKYPRQELGLQFERLMENVGILCFGWEVERA